MAACIVDADAGVEGGGVRMERIKARRRDARGVGHLAGIIDHAGALVSARERAAGDVANAGGERNAQGAQVVETGDLLDVGKTNADEIARLQIAEIEIEEILASHFGEGGAATFVLLLLEDPPGLFALEDFCFNDTIANMQLATIDGRVGGKRKGVGAVERI
jgi:hypothetical protein